MSHKLQDTTCWNCMHCNINNCYLVDELILMPDIHLCLVAGFCHNLGLWCKFPAYLLTSFTLLIFV